MKDIMFTIGPFQAHWYGFMIGIGVFIAYYVGEYRAKKMGLNHDLMFSLTIWCLIGGLFGARVLFYLTQIKEIIQNPSLLFNFTEGFVVYGGIIFGVFTGYLFSLKRKINFLEYFDLVMPSIALAQAFGRIGCFFAGCCYGVETDSWLHIVFHSSKMAPNGIPLLPTQLISSALNFLHFYILLVFAKRKKADGQVGGLYLICYSIGRFILEFYRGDLERGKVGVLSTSQFISLFLVVIGMVFFFGVGKLKKDRIKML